MSELGSIRSVQAWALVPVKPPIWAKTRLSALLSADERVQLQWAMLQDVLDQLQASRWLSGVAIVCPDPRIQALVAARGIRVIGDEPQAGGLNAAVAHGVDRLRRGGADLVAVLPGDVPLLTTADFDRAILSAVQENATIVVPDHNCQGTNALVFWTDHAPKFQFGTNSNERHLGDRSNGPVRAMPLASITRDIDLPDDLTALRRRRGQGGAPRTNAALDKCTCLAILALSEDTK